MTTTPEEDEDNLAIPATPPMHPRRLFIASIGNQKPYRNTRHSAGHILLDALSPLLHTLPPVYTTWYSPSYMNESGPKLVRQLQRWFEKGDGGGSGGWVSASGIALPLSSPSTSTGGSGSGSGSATLVILHDELESPLGKIRVRRGGPEAASLRGHRGLISICESLRGKGLYPPKQQQKGNGKGGAAPPRDLSILRVGVGIGRPESRGKNAVADYVLTEMEARELEAVRRAAGPVVKILEEEVVFTGDAIV